MNKETEYENAVRNFVDLDLEVTWSLDDEYYDEPHEESTVMPVTDALVKSINRFGRVDMRWISIQTGKDIYELKEDLAGLVYCDPDAWNKDIFEGWELADEYLSGNIRRKCIRAKVEDQQFPGMFRENVEALERAKPVPLYDSEIFVTLGSPLPPDIIESFINELFDLPGSLRYNDTVIYDEITGSWEITDKWRFKGSVQNGLIFGTPRLGAVDIIDATLNMREIRITDEVSSETTKSGKTRVTNEDETAAAKEKQRLITREFRTWIWRDRTRAKRVREHFNKKFSYYVARTFDGRMFEFPRLSKLVNIYPYVKDFAATIILRKGCTLLAPDTGAGKTYIMIIAGMELRRLGLAKKVMYVVPNGILEQWRDTFMMLYPEARILCIGPKEFRKDVQQKVLADIRDNDTYDGIIIASSCFDNIPLSRNQYVESLSDEKKRLMAAKRKKETVTSALDKKIDKISKKRGEAAVEHDAASEGICFDMLGIDRLFVDEAHNYKNVSIDTTLKTSGINHNGSAKCDDMLQKVRHVQKKNGGGGVVFATATPISNSIADLYVMQQYLQNGELNMIELSTFNSWIGTFAEQENNFEVAVDTNTYRFATRFSKFHNIQELTTLLSSIALFHSAEDSVSVPRCNYREIVLPPSAELRNILDKIAVRADKVHRHLVKPKEDNMLKITIDGRKAALDSIKVSACADRVAEVYARTAKERSTQLVFCDIFTPSGKAKKQPDEYIIGRRRDIYGELKSELIVRGVKPEEIAFIHDATTSAKRERLFAKVRNGDIRIVLGSTSKLGTGVNVQDRLIAVHHLDVPWKPSEMVQREGRILRPGNMNDEVEIYRYITEGSFDAYSWQILDTKEKFIKAMLAGTETADSADDVDESVLSYAEVKALAIGNPDLKACFERKNELQNLYKLNKREIASRLRLEQRKEELPDLIRNKKSEYLGCMNDIEEACKTVREAGTKRSDAEKKQRQEAGERIASAVKANAMKRSEHMLMKYRGFLVVLPSRMDERYPYVWLIRKGKYRVDLSDKEKGIMVRLDNFLDDKLERRAKKLNDDLDMLKHEQADIDAELSKPNEYIPKIKEKERALKEIEERIGIKNE